MLSLFCNQELCSHWLVTKSYPNIGYFVHNKRYCTRIKLAKEFHSKCYVFSQLGQCYHVKLAEIIDTQHPDNCFKNLMEIIDWDFKSTVESCIIDILLDIMDYS